MLTDLATQIALAGLVAPLEEYRFAPPRRWRFDLAWPDRRIAVEMEGGTWNGGRHVRGRGYEADCEKYNAAALHGWTVLRFTSDMIRDGRALNAIRCALDQENNHALTQMKERK
jgi:very-short-patch-repair endonuclease